MIGDLAAFRLEKLGYRRDDLGVWRKPGYEAAIDLGAAPGMFVLVAPLEMLGKVAEVVTPPLVPTRDDEGDQGVPVPAGGALPEFRDANGAALALGDMVTLDGDDALLFVEQIAVTLVPGQAPQTEPEMVISEANAGSGDDRSGS